MKTLTSVPDVLDSLKPGELAAAINAKKVPNDMETMYLFDPDFVAKHWSEFRLGYIKDENEYCLSVIGTEKIMRITEEGAKALIKKMGLVYKPTNKKGGQWVESISAAGSQNPGNLAQRCLAKTRRILGHTT